MDVNVAMLTGDVGASFDDHWILKAQRLIPRRGEKPQIFTDEVSVAGEAPKDKRVTVAGQMIPTETENGIRTYLAPKSVKKAKKSDYQNVALLVGKFFQWRPMRSNPKKVPFGNQLLKVLGLDGIEHTLRAILFDNPNFRIMSAWETELSVKDAAREGSIIEAEGRLRNNSYKDNDGVQQTMLEMVVDKIHVIEAAENQLRTMQEEWDSEAEQDSSAESAEEGSDIPI